MLRFFDIILSLFGLLVFTPIFIIFILFMTNDYGNVIFKQKRVGKNQKIFTIFKLRSMKLNTKNKPSHYIKVQEITKIGYFLRKYKLDEFPQVWNVLIGDMSMVGPRPCLPIQKELIKKRLSKKIFKVRPGITGLAQLNGVDMSNPKKLVELDCRMLKEFNLLVYLKYIVLTVLGKKMSERYND